MSADRPERNSLTHILAHNGYTTKRLKYSAYINQEKLPSCKKCLQQRLSDNWNSVSEINIDSCRFCCNWNYFSKNPLLHYPLPDLSLIHI